MEYFDLFSIFSDSDGDDDDDDDDDDDGYVWLLTKLYRDDFPYVYWNFLNKSVFMFFLLKLVFYRVNVACK